MHVVSYIVLALAFGICDMLLFARCSSAVRVRLSRGLLCALCVAAIHALLFLGGAALGNLFRIEGIDAPHLFDSANCWIFFGLAFFVAARFFFPYLWREPRLPLFDLSHSASVAAMAVASGVNVLLVGVGVGFADALLRPHACFWPMLVACFLLGYLGLMFGRQAVALRPRRWAALASLALLGVAVAALLAL